MRRRHRNNPAPVSLLSFQDIVTSLSGIMILLVLFLALEVAVGKSVGDARPPAEKGPSRPADETAGRDKEDLLEEKLKNAPSLTPLETAGAVVEVKYLLRERAERKNKLDRQVERLEEQLRRAERAKEDRKSRIREMEKALSELEKDEKSALDDNRVSFIPAAPSELKPVLAECSGESIRAGRLDNGAPETFSPDTDGFLDFVDRLDSRKEYVVFIIKPSGADYAMELVQEVRRKGFRVGYDALEENRRVAFGKPEGSRK